jgi:hypothetical protein
MHKLHSSPLLTPNRVDVTCFGALGYSATVGGPKETPSKRFWGKAQLGSTHVSTCWSAGCQVSPTTVTKVPSLADTDASTLLAVPHGYLLLVLSRDCLAGFGVCVHK